MKVLITGAQFNNKGAQSLLFTTMDMLRKKYGDVTIYYMPLDEFRSYPKNTYKFNLVYGDWDAHLYEQNKMKRPYIAARSILRSCIKKNAVSLNDVKELHRVLDIIDTVIDVSGYQLTSKFDIAYNVRFLGYIEEAKAHGKPIILMPQSFGPFNYGKESEQMMERIGNTLKKADLIFAREKEGYDLLKSLYGLTNIQLSPDLVLQGGRIDPKNIYISEPQYDVPVLQSKGNVAIIPNQETVKHGQEDEIIALYSKIIDTLIDDGKTVYIMRHSNDLELCRKIYETHEQNERVILLERNLSCFEYSAFISQFDYIVASRYHAIVHAYKEGIPAVILGWAVKYSSLSEIFGQDEFVFDISGSNASLRKATLLQKIGYMDQHHEDEANKIVLKTRMLKQDSCFGRCWALLDQI